MSNRLLDAALEIDLFNECPLLSIKAAADVNIEEALVLAEQASGLSGDDQVACLDAAKRKARRVLLVDNSEVLSFDEICAINLYTLESPLYKNLNALLRSRKRTALQPLFPYLKILLTGLHKLKPLSDTIFRGVKLDLSEWYQAGAEIVWWGFSSATSSVAVLESFLGKTGCRTVFSVKTCSVDIRKYSAIAAEDERLVVPGSQFVCKSTLNLGGGVSIVQLEQNVDAQSLLSGFGFSTGSFCSFSSCSASSARKRGGGAKDDEISTEAKDDGKDESSNGSESSSSNSSSKVSHKKLRKKDGPVVMFSGLDPISVTKLAKTVSKLGGGLSEDLRKCSHFITNVVRRTEKFLCALGAGKTIIHVSWVLESKKANKFLDPEQYLLSDPVSEKKFSFSLKNSIQKARGQPLLKGWRVYCTISVKPDRDTATNIVKSCGGMMMTFAPSNWTDEILVISCEKDQKQCSALLKLGFTIHHNEVLLTGLLRQELDLTGFVLYAAQTEVHPS